MAYHSLKFGDVQAQFERAMNNSIAKMLQKLSRTYSIYGMALKLFPQTILLLKVDHFEGFLNQCKTDRIVNDNSSSCNS